MKIMERMMTNHVTYRKPKRMTPKGVMVHSTATPGVGAERFCAKWNDTGVVKNLKKSIHAFVDNTGVYQTLPWEYEAWHCAGKGNHTHVGFEMCEPKGIIYNTSGSRVVKYEPDEEYFPSVWKNAVELTAYLCNAYGINPDIKGNIICHNEGAILGLASNHIDTKHWFPLENKSMDDFRHDVVAAIKSLNIASE